MLFQHKLYFREFYLPNHLASSQSSSWWTPQRSWKTSSCLWCTPLLRIKHYRQWECTNTRKKPLVINGHADDESLMIDCVPNLPGRPWGGALAQGSWQGRPEPGSPGERSLKKVSWAWPSSKDYTLFLGWAVARISSYLVSLGGRLPVLSRNNWQTHLREGDHWSSKVDSNFS